MTQVSDVAPGPLVDGSIHLWGKNDWKLSLRRAHFFLEIRNKFNPYHLLYKIINVM
jgi:hypothetical protein